MEFLKNEEICEAESWAAVAPTVAETAPAEDNLITVLVEIRDVLVAVAVPNVMYKAPSILSITP